MSVAQEPDFITDDLALASFLHMEGHEFKIDVQGRKAHFVFSPCDEIAGDVSDYRDGIVEVEPREYTQATAHVRRRMYTVLGIRNGRQ